MKIDNSNIYEFLSRTETEFHIPRYQRPYSWDERNIQDFWRDIGEVLKGGRNHYFGNILYFNKDRESKSSTATSDPQVSVIVDGQQRITTVMLMLTAIYHLAKETGRFFENPEWINNAFLLNSRSQKLKLRTVVTDDEHFQSIMDRKDLQSRTQSYLHEAYHFFYNSLSESKDLGKYVNALRNLEIASMRLDHKDDNPQRIFESINATGKILTEGDKIRNYALMLKRQNDSNHVYQQYWQHIESRLTKGKSVDIQNFFRNYLISIFSKSVKNEDVYTEFKEHFTKSNPSSALIQKEKARKYLDNFYSGVMQNLDRYIFLKYEAPMHALGSKYSLFNDQASRLSYLRAEIAWPFFMSVLEKYDQEELTQDQVVQIFNITEDHLVKKFLSEGSVKGLEKIYYTMSSRIRGYLKGDSGGKDYVKTYKYTLDNDDPPPTDEKLRSGIEERDFYTTTTGRRYLTFILASVEDKQSGASSRLLRELAGGNSDYSIEHIIPQKLNPEWKQELGSRSKDIQKKWLNTLPNLTLVRRNVEMSNSSFSKKKSYLAQDSLHLNKGIINCARWNEESLEKRAEWWFETIKSMWR